MPYTLALIDEASRDLVVTALNAAADVRSRAAEKIAKIVRIDKAARKDVRSDSVRVTALLGEAAELRAAATMLAEAQDVALVQHTPGPVVVDAATGAPAPPPVDPGPVDDGTSPDAQALAELAGLTGYDPEDDPIDLGTIEVQA